MSLATLFPGPQPVTLAGYHLEVSPWRLRDILEIERWLLAESRFPLEDIPGIDDDPEPGTRKRRLRGAMAKAKDWPPQMDSDNGREMLATPQGAAFFLWTALSRDNPDFTVETIPALLEGMTLLDWKRLNRVLWQSHPQEEILREIIPERFDSEDGTAWPQVIDHLARERNRDYEWVLDRTLPEISNMLRQGEPRKFGLANPSSEAVRDYNRRMLDDDEIPAWEARQRELDEQARLTEEQARREQAPSNDPTLQRDAARLGMDPNDLASKLAELDAKVTESGARDAASRENQAQLGKRES